MKTDSEGNPSQYNHNDSSRVTVLPESLSFEVQQGENIRAAAIRNGYTWPNICGGEGKCFLCFMEIVKGEEFLGAISALEATGLKRLKGTLPHLTAPLRLACQTTASGDITVLKKGVRRA